MRQIRDPWFIRNRRRYSDELKAVEDSGLPLRLIVRGILRGWEGTIKVGEESHVLRVLYPPDFPEVPPLLFDSPDFKLELLDDHKTAHQLANFAG